MTTSTISVRAIHRNPISGSLVTSSSICGNSICGSPVRSYTTFFNLSFTILSNKSLPPLLPTLTRRIEESYNVKSSVKSYSSPGR